MLWTDGWTHRPWDEPLALVQPPPPPHSPWGWAAATPQSSSMGIWTEALQTHFLPWSRPLTGTGLAPGHPARLPSIRGSIAPRCSRGPSRPPCSHPVCSFLMSSRSGLEPGPFSSSGHLGGSQRIWGWLRRWVTKKLPLRREHTSRLPPSCCHLCDSAPPLWSPPGALSPPPFLCHTVLGQDGADGEEGAASQQRENYSEEAAGERREQPRLPQPLRVPCCRGGGGNVGGDSPPGTPAAAEGEAAHPVPWQSVIPNPGGDFTVLSLGLAFGVEFYQQQLSKINKKACACQC